MITIARHVGEKIAKLIDRAPAGGIFHDAKIGEVAVVRGHIGSKSPVDFQLDLQDGGSFLVRVEPIK
jgi:hypothetical protein